MGFGSNQDRESVDPRHDLPICSPVLELLLTSLNREEYEALTTKDVPFTQEERQAFVKMAEALNLVPTPDPGAKRGAKKTAARARPR